MRVKPSGIFCASHSALQENGRLFVILNFDSIQFFKPGSVSEHRLPKMCTLPLVPYGRVRDWMVVRAHTQKTRWNQCDGAVDDGRLVPFSRARGERLRETLFNHGCRLFFRFFFFSTTPPPPTPSLIATLVCCNSSTTKDKNVKLAFPSNNNG